MHCTCHFGRLVVLGLTRLPARQEVCTGRDNWQAGKSALQLAVGMEHHDCTQAYSALTGLTGLWWFTSMIAVLWHGVIVQWLRRTATCGGTSWAHSGHRAGVGHIERSRPPFASAHLVLLKARAPCGIGASCAQDVQGPVKPH